MTVFPTRVLPATDGSEEACLAGATAADAASEDRPPVLTCPHEDGQSREEVWT